LAELTLNKLLAEKSATKYDKTANSLMVYLLADLSARKFKTEINKKVSGRNIHQ
jgi:hypothetical protein